MTAGFSMLEYVHMKTTKAMLWTGRVMTGLTSAFFLFDAFGKFTAPQAVVEASAALGFGPDQLMILGLLLLISTVLYIIPRTSVLGAVLLTGYLGGAVASHYNADNIAFNCVFPVIFGIIVWGGLYLRKEDLRKIFPVRM
jgi:hypothetical protein